MDQQNDRAQAPVIVARADHPVSRSQISGNALKVFYRLRDAGYQAFLVGGCVRDLLIGIVPKDFDIATDASPEEMRRLFRNCRLICRRFRLAQIRFGHQVIEVATFRASGVPMAPEGMEEDDGESGDAEEATGSQPEEERNRSTASTTTADACFATTSTAQSTRTSGAATSPAMRCTTTSRTSRSGTTSAASRTSAPARSA